MINAAPVVHAVVHAVVCAVVCAVVHAAVAHAVCGALCSALPLALAVVRHEGVGTLYVSDVALCTRRGADRVCGELGAGVGASPSPRASGPLRTATVPLRAKRKW